MTTSSGLRRTARLLCVLVMVIGVWVAFTSARRLNVERDLVETLAPPGGRFVSVHGATLFVQEWGAADAPTLLLTHGTGAWSGTWFDTPQALAAAGWHVVAVDLPPFGLSATADVADYRRETQAQRLLALIDALGRGPVALVGHSFGAGPALEAALRGPDRLRQLVLVDPALGLGSAGEAPACEPPGIANDLLAWRGLRTTVLAAAVTPPWFTSFWLRQFVARAEAVTPERVLAYQRPFTRTRFTERLGDWASTFARASCEGAWSLQAATVKQHLSTVLPVTLLWGEQDDVTPLAQARTLQQWLPQAQLLVLPGVGHIPHIEDAAAFHAALTKVLRR